MMIVGSNSPSLPRTSRHEMIIWGAILAIQLLQSIAILAILWRIR